MSEEHVPNPLWETDATHPELAIKVRDALRQVMDPELALSVIELGLVREIWVDDEVQHVKMIMTTPFCPYASALLDTTRSSAEQAAELTTMIEMAMDPWDPSMMEEGAGADWGLF
jgi:metal-sulfur cluster biosynthetic enzyme